MTGNSPPAEDIDALFRLPPAEFVGARNALAARLRRVKDIAAADAVKALAKPSVSAWVVNQLYWDHREDFDRLLTAGARLRADQQRGLQGGRSSERQAATGERREVMTGLLRRAELVLAGDGRSATPATLKRVETNLEAIAALGGGGSHAELGRMVRDLEPPGFDALLALAAAAPLASPPTPSTKTAEARGSREATGVRAKPEASEAPRAPNAPKPSTDAETRKPARTPLRKTRSSPEAETSTLPQAQAQVAEAVERLDHCRQLAGEAEAARAAAARTARLAVAEVSEAQRRLTRAEKQASEADVALKRTQARKGLVDEDVARAEETLAAARAAARRARSLSE